MKQVDEYYIKKYHLNEAEAEDFIERMGIMVEDGRQDETQAAKKCIKIIMDERRKENKKHLNYR